MAARLVISVLIFFLFTATLFSISAADASPSSSSSSSSSLSLVERVCRDASDRSFCVKVLWSDRRSHTAKNNMDLAVIALQLGISNSTRTRVYIARKYRRNLKKADSRRKAGLKGCLWGYEGAIGSFKSALMELSEDPLTANYDSKVASDGAEYCSDSLRRAGINDSTISDGNWFTSAFSDIAFTITNDMD